MKIKRNGSAENDIYALQSLLSYHERVITPLQEFDETAVAFTNFYAHALKEGIRCIALVNRIKIP